MKKKRAILLTIVLSCLLATSAFIVRAVKAATTGTVGATVTAVIYSVSLDNGDGIAFGSVGQGSSADSTSAGANDSTTAENDGSVTEKLNIKAADSTGGAGWTMATDPGSETFGLNYCISDCDGTPSWLTVGVDPSYATLVASLGVGITQIFDIQVETPTSTTETTEQAITVTVQAVAP